MTPENTVCTGCSEVKPATIEFFEFNKQTGRLRLRCIECRRRVALAHYHSGYGARRLAERREQTAIRRANAPQLPHGMKMCSKCKALLPASTEHFSPAKGALHSWCKPCGNAAVKKRWASLPKEARKTRGERSYAKRKHVLKERANAQIDVQPAVIPTSEKVVEQIGHVPFGLAGIYQIRNLATGQLYVGSAQCIRGRWATHIWRLGKGSHHSRRLQGAWKRDGYQGFAFEVLEQITNLDLLVTIEQAWIDFLHSYVLLGGYNSSPKAGSTRGIRHTAEQRAAISAHGYTTAKPYVVTWPDGKTEQIDNLTLFCGANGLNASSMRACGLGKYRSHVGFSCRKFSLSAEEWEERVRVHEVKIAAKYARNRSKAPSYCVVFPDGRQEVVGNLTQFCSKQGLVRAAMQKLIPGKTHRGFTCERLTA